MNAEIIKSKYPLILGGFLGFVLTFFAGLFAGNSFVAALMNASIGCVVGAFLMKFFLFVLVLGLRSVEREKEVLIQEQEEKEKKKEAT